MPRKNDIPLPFNCGVCAKPLTDNSALLTSCGHLFCVSPPSRCTELSASRPAGKCEQCGKQCDAGTLTNRAAGYDDRVKSFIFEDLHDLLVQTADIIKVRYPWKSLSSFWSVSNMNVSKKNKKVRGVVLRW